MHAKRKQSAEWVRRLLGTLHLWLGLTLGLFWALQGLTGAALVFHRELDRLALPAPRSGVTLPLDRLLAATAGRLPSRAESIGVIDGDPSILVINYTDRTGSRQGVLVNAASGSVIANRDWRPSSPADGQVTRWLYNIHHQALAGETGGLLLGASGLFLVVSAAWGTWLAWPRRNHWRATFDIRRWRSRNQQLYGWHRASGLCAALALVLLALTGAIMDFSKPLRAISERYLPYRSSFPAEPSPLPEHLAGADRALAAARSSLPQAAFVSLTLPSAKLPAYQVRMRQPGEWRNWSGTSVVTVAASSGAVLDVYDAAEAPLANRLLESSFAVHSGEVAGMAGRLAVFLAGLSLPMLYVTGVWSWLRRRRRASQARP